MKFRALSCLLAMSLPMAAIAAEEAPPATPKPSLWHRLLHPFGASEDEGAKVRGTNFKKLEMGMEIDPNPVRLGDNKQVKVTLTLTTLDAGGITEKDFTLARQCDEVFAKSSVP